MIGTTMRPCREVWGDGEEFVSIASVQLYWIEQFQATQPQENSMLSTPSNEGLRRYHGSGVMNGMVEQVGTRWLPAWASWHGRLRGVSR
jgi:hypothetical protein